MPLPSSLHWLFWEAVAETIDVERDADYVIPRILEFGRLADVRWGLQAYGAERIHRFLRDVGHPELSPRTLAFWRAFFRAEGEAWQTSNRSQMHSSVL
jgi:hypothetical protein